jgi:hypothetical protein
LRAGAPSRERPGGDPGQTRVSPGGAGRRSARTWLREPTRIPLLMNGTRAMRTITAKDGTEIDCKHWGPGPVVTFSHGWPLNADAWDGQMLCLVQHGYRVVAHDRCGRGRSSQPGQPGGLSIEVWDGAWSCTARTARSSLSTTRRASHHQREGDLLSGRAARPDGHPTRTRSTPTCSPSCAANHSRHPGRVAGDLRKGDSTMTDGRIAAEADAAPKLSGESGLPRWPSSPA